MLKPLLLPPSNLGKKGEITKHSAALDRMTGDTGDLRIHTATDGKLFLRVWEGTADAGVARWYECVPPDEEPETPEAASDK